MSNSSIFTYKFNRYFSPYQMAWIDYGFAKKAVMPALFLAFILPVFGAIISALGIFRLKISSNSRRRTAVRLFLFK